MMCGFPFLSALGISPFLPNVSYNSCGISYLCNAPLLLLENMATTEVSYTSHNYFRRESIFSPIIIRLAFIQMSFTQWQTLFAYT